MGSDYESIMLGLFMSAREEDDESEEEFWGRWWDILRDWAFWGRVGLGEELGLRLGLG